MPAYFIAQLEVTDHETYQKYLAGFMPVFERHGGRLLATSAGETTVYEGQWDAAKTVVMEFPDTEAANNWFNDPDYREIAAYRHASARCNLVLVEGLDQ